MKYSTNLSTRISDGQQIKQAIIRIKCIIIHIILLLLCEEVFGKYIFSVKSFISIHTPTSLAWSKIYEESNVGCGHH